MPLTAKVDHARRLVMVTGSGTVAPPDLLDYQKSVWSRTDIAGYDELADMTGVEHFALDSGAAVRELAALSVNMDVVHGGSRLAIVAPGETAHTLARMYEASRQADDRSKRVVAVFRTRPDALRWLGHAGSP